MKFQLILLLCAAVALQTAASIEEDSERASSEVLNQLDNIKIKLKSIKSDVVEKYTNEKFQWQLEVLQNWFADEAHGKCLQDISQYVFPEWLVVQKRLDGNEDFSRNLTEYEQGFGNIRKEYFMGLRKLYELTSNTHQSYELLIFLGYDNKTIGYVHYDKFRIDGPNEKYMLKELGEYQGTDGDFMRDQLNRKFSTFDQETNESNAKQYEVLKGGWWYRHSSDSHINDFYRKASAGRKGINWIPQNEIKLIRLHYTLMLIKERSAEK